MYIGGLGAETKTDGSGRPISDLARIGKQMYIHNFTRSKTRLSSGNTHTVADNSRVNVDLDVISFETHPNPGLGRGCFLENYDRGGSLPSGNQPVHQRPG